MRYGRAAEGVSGTPWPYPSTPKLEVAATSPPENLPLLHPTLKPSRPLRASSAAFLQPETLHKETVTGIFFVAKEAPCC
jgi:hypothetical protein